MFPNSYPSKIGEEGDAKIADFGLSQSITDGDKGAGDKMMGTLRWMSPEIAVKKCKSLEKNDVWAYGVILLEIGYFEQVSFADGLVGLVVYPTGISQTAMYGIVYESKAFVTFRGLSDFQG
jgi:serine/threonine protein kinase